MSQKIICDRCKSVIVPGVTGHLDLSIDKSDVGNFDAIAKDYCLNCAFDVVRKAHSDKLDQINAMVDAGFSRPDANRLLTADFCGRFVEAVRKVLISLESGEG